MKISTLRPEFVVSVPEPLTDGVLYISERYRICSHKCCCGCGEEVVTPLSPAEWQLTREGDLVSLWPSIGNWDYACQSHYIIRRNEVIPSFSMTSRQIDRVRQRDAADLARMVAARNHSKAPLPGSDEPSLDPSRGPGQHSDSDATRPRQERLLDAIWRALFGR